MIFIIDNSKQSIARMGKYLSRYTEIRKPPEETLLQDITRKIQDHDTRNDKDYLLLSIDNSSVSFLKKVAASHIKILAIQEDFSNNQEPSAYAESLYKQNLLADNGALIFSVSLLFGTDFINFAENVISKIQNGEMIDADKNLYVSPVLVDEAAEYLYQNIDKSGYIRFLSDKQISLYNFACDIAEKNILDSTFVNNAITEYSIFDSKCNQDAIITDYRSSIQNYANQKKCLFNLIYRLKPYDSFENRAVASVRYDIGKSFSATISSDIADDIDCIVPIPQTGITYANGIADGLHKPLLYAIFQKSNTSETFNVADVFKRKCLIKNKLSIIGELLQDKRIGLVDEAVFTGATLKIVCESLQAFNVKKVHILIPSPLGTKRCINYVQPNRTISGERRIPNISAYFSADTITFADKSLFSQYNDYCSGCMT